MDALEEEGGGEGGLFFFNGEKAGGQALPQVSICLPQDSGVARALLFSVLRCESCRITEIMMTTLVLFILPGKSL